MYYCNLVDRELKLLASGNKAHVQTMFKESHAGLVTVPLFGKFHCVICVPA